jgi:hypothetical protein
MLFPRGGFARPCPTIAAAALTTIKAQTGLTGHGAGESRLGFDLI